MPKPSVCDASRLNQLLSTQQQIITRTQALGCGMPSATLGHRIAPSGSWQVLLPGVYFAGHGGISSEQKAMAALLYAGSRSIITGTAAIYLHRVPCPFDDMVDVLVPLNVRRQSVGFVRLHRTSRLPERFREAGRIRFAFVPRAVVDAARASERLDDVRTIVFSAVQTRRCTVAQLVVEHRKGSPARSAALGLVLREVSDGVRSVAEAQLRTLIIRSKIIRPMFNAKLYTPDGIFLAMVDAWWEEAGVAAEVDSREYHSSWAAQNRDRERHDKLVAHGILLLHFAPSHIRSDRMKILGTLEDAIRKGLQRPLLRIVAVPADEEWPCPGRCASARHIAEKPPSTYTVVPDT